MKILDNMTITEAAEYIRCVALKIKEDKQITEQQAYKLIFKDIEKHLGGIDDDIRDRG